MCQKRGEPLNLSGVTGRSWLFIHAAGPVQLVQFLARGGFACCKRQNFLHATTKDLANAVFLTASCGPGDQGGAFCSHWAKRGRSRHRPEPSRSVLCTLMLSECSNRTLNGALNLGERCGGIAPRTLSNGIASNVPPDSSHISRMSDQARELVQLAARASGCCQATRTAALIFFFPLPLLPKEPSSRSMSFKGKAIRHRY